jgi:hypothetical protein
MLARDRTSDLDPRSIGSMREYASLEPHEGDKAVLMTSPQSVGRVS